MVADVFLWFSIVIGADCLLVNTLGILRGVNKEDRGTYVQLAGSYFIGFPIGILYAYLYGWAGNDTEDPHDKDI